MAERMEYNFRGKIIKDMSAFVLLSLSDYSLWGKLAAMS